MPSLFSFRSPVRFTADMTESLQPDASSGTNIPSEDHAGRAQSLATWGFGATVAYVVGMTAWAVCQRRELIAMGPADFGTLLAGVFSPLAFLWLVLGFLQQGQELRASVDALKLQGEELRNSVEQQRQLAEATREQLALNSRTIAAQQEEMERSAQPKFELECIGSQGAGTPDTRLYNFAVSNFGRPVTDLRIVDATQNKFVRRMPIIGTGERTDFMLEMPVLGDEKRNVRIVYIDGRGFHRSRLYGVRKDGHNIICAEKPEE